jgi:hypothetical protein
MRRGNIVHGYRREDITKIELVGIVPEEANWIEIALYDVQRRSCMVTVINSISTLSQENKQ